MAAQDRARRAVGDQLAEADCPAIDDRARGRIEAYHRYHYIMCFTGLRFGQTYLGIFRVGEAADWTHLVPKRRRRASYGVGGRYEAVLDRLRNEHQAAGDIAGGEDVWRRSTEVSINPYVAPRIGLDTRRREAQSCGVGHPAHRHNCECSLSIVLYAVLRENHAHPVWCL